ncbi:MAG: amidohydrolase family protein, partial [Acidimicrobiia bacterium]
MTRYAVISADGHAGPPAEIYREYLDPGFRDRFDEHQRAMEELRAAMGRSTPSDFQQEWEAETGGDGGLTAAYESAARNAILDEEGVAAEVLFPDADVLGTGRVASSPFGTGLAGASDNVEEAVAGSRAHNRWLADFVREEPTRRIGIAVVPAIIPDMDT